jgi:hypothetical protein
VLALQMQRAAEIRCGLPWARIAHELGALKAVRYQAGYCSAHENHRCARRVAEKARNSNTKAIAGRH